MCCSALFGLERSGSLPYVVLCIHPRGCRRAGQGPGIFAVDCDRFIELVFGEQCIGPGLQLSQCILCSGLHCIADFARELLGELGVVAVWMTCDNCAESFNGADIVVRVGIYMSSSLLVEFTGLLFASFCGGRLCGHRLGCGAAPGLWP